jgi:hypothetical protein
VELRNLCSKVLHCFFWMEKGCLILYHFSKLAGEIVLALIPQPLLPSWEKGSKRERSLSRIKKNGIKSLSRLGVGLQK